MLLLLLLMLLQGDRSSSSSSVSAREPCEGFLRICWRCCYSIFLCLLLLLLLLLRLRLLLMLLVEPRFIFPLQHPSLLLPPNDSKICKGLKNGSTQMLKRTESHRGSLVIGP